MPNTKSAKKRLRQNIVRRDRNRAFKSRMGGALRKFREALSAGDLEKAQELSRSNAQLLDKLAAKRVIHPNKAARLKSRMSHLIVSSKSA